jgi:hypothetical protein
LPSRDGGPSWLSRLAWRYLRFCSGLFELLIA